MSYELRPGVISGCSDAAIKPRRTCHAQEVAYPVTSPDGGNHARNFEAKSLAEHDGLEHSIFALTSCGLALTATTRLAA
jgi:hypothetical protein